MAKKNWLIRTKNKQILGPATRDKIITLIEKGNLTNDDELSTGNGFWFWVREGELLDEYLYSERKQNFNIISEAIDVLEDRHTTVEEIEAFVASFKDERKKVNFSEEGDTYLPSDVDLEYPSEEDLRRIREEELFIGKDKDEETRVIEIGSGSFSAIDEEISEDVIEEVGDDERVSGEDALSLDEMVVERLGDEVESLSRGRSRNADIQRIIDEEDDEEAIHYPDSDDLDYPDVEPNEQYPTIDDEGVIKDEKFDGENENPTLQEKENKLDKERRPRNDIYLLILAFLVLSFLIGITYYFSVILNKPFLGRIISSAEAQVTNSIGKKKAFLKRRSSPMSSSQYQ